MAVARYRMICLVLLGHTLNFCPNLVQYRFKNMYLKESLTRSSTVILSTNYTLLNRLYGEWQCDLFTWYFRFQNTCNRNKFVWISRWISGFYITKSCRECHWTPFYPRNTLRGREYHFPVVRMFLREFSHKQCAETSVHKTTHPAVTKMTIVNFLVNVLQHNFNKQFQKQHFL